MDMFGRVPAEISGALFKSESLGDVPDKAAARKNLNVPSVEEVMYAGVPVGTIIHFYGTISPAGFLICMGQTITSAAFPNLVEFLNPGGASAVLPDFRGEFLRGLDVGRNMDPGRALASKQNMGPLGTTATVSNAALLICIKAYDAVRNMNATLDISSLVSAQTGLLSDVLSLAGRATNSESGISALQGRTSNLEASTSSVQSRVRDLESGSLFNGNKQLLDSDGYQIFPGGLMAQWAYVPAGAQVRIINANVANNENVHIVRFKIPFQNQCLGVMIAGIDGSTASLFSENSGVQIRSSTKTDFLAKRYWKDPGSYVSGSNLVLEFEKIGYRYVAIGF